MPSTSLSVDELVSTLSHSRLPTLLVEGDTDVMIFRKLERLPGPTSMDVLPCGSRNTLLEVFKRREEFSHLRVHFFADQDLWMFSGIPKEYANIHFTHGYSIENDIYSDGHVALSKLLSSDEQNSKQQILDKVAAWFAREVELSLGGIAANFAEISILSTNVMGKGDTDFTPTFLAHRNFVPASPQMVEEVKADHYLRMRGKFIFQAYHKIFEQFRKGSDPQATWYGYNQLIDICLRECIFDEKNPTKINQLTQRLIEDFG